MTNPSDLTDPEERHAGPGARPPRRPTALSRAELDFDPQPATRWYNPDVLVTAGVRQVLTSVFGSFLDKRELQSNLPAEPDVRFADEDDLWVDYIADMGDGFPSTYTMASLLARRELKLPDGDTTLQRGRVLVLGGDEVYPAATTDNYEQRLSGPFRAALPWTPGDHPSLYALPGNHDWYDGLTGFLRLFGQHRWLGGWRTRQTRSYFAVQLPHRWWLWGMDMPSDQFVDEPQLRFFEDVLERHSQPGDRLLLAVPEPSWIATEKRPDAFRNVAYVEHTLLRRHRVSLEAALGGDLHHYARYSLSGTTPTGVEKVVHEPVEDDRGLSVHSDDALARRPRHLLTAGGGGAFLHPTHDLPTTLDVPAEPGRETPAHRYEQAATYPPASTSRRLAWAALLLPLRNPGFLWVGAALHVAVLWTNQFGLRSLSHARTLSYAGSARQSGWQDLALGLVRNPAGGVGLTCATFGLVLLARKPPWTRRRGVEWLVRVLLGLTHMAAHVAAFVLVALLAIRLASGLGTSAGFVIATTVLVAALGSVVTAVVVGAYFAAANTLPRLRVHGNEAFSASRPERHRSFLRLHVDPTGRLHVYVVGVDRMVRRWKPDPDTSTADPERSWLVPDGDPPRPHLVEHLVID